jgi:hypothetical protein
MATTRRTAAQRPRTAVAREDPSFPWFIGAALATALAGGFLLAVLLPLAVVLEWEWGVRWRALVQVHGHLQMTGWLGLFITGMALRLAPRFAGRPLRPPRYPRRRSRSSPSRWWVGPLPSRCSTGPGCARC